MSPLLRQRDLDEVDDLPVACERAPDGLRKPRESPWEGVTAAALAYADASTDAAFGRAKARLRMAVLRYARSLLRANGKKRPGQTRRRRHHARSLLRANGKKRPGQTRRRRHHA